MVSIETCDSRRTLPCWVQPTRDNVASHDKFKKKHDLRFVLVSDADGKASEAHGTWVEKSMYGRKCMSMDSEKVSSA